MSDRAYIFPGLLILGIAAYAFKNRSERQVRQSFANLDVAITGVHDEQGALVMTVKVLNPNSAPMEVRSLVGSMYVNGSLVAKINMMGDYIAAANNQVTLPILMQPVSANIATQLRQRIRDRWHGRTSFRGTINVNNQALPLQLNYTN